MTLQQRQEVQISYYPHEHQMSFHQDRGRVRYRLVSAGTGSGKTFCGVDEDLSWALDYAPGSVGIIFEPTYKMINRILLEQTLEHWRFLGKPLEANPLVHDFHKTEMHLELKARGGRISDIYFISLEEPEAAEGSSIDWAHIDEGRLVPHFQEAHESVLRRLRGSGRGSFPTGLWITTTPPPPNTYMFNFYENSKTRDPASKVYRWSLIDNVYADKNYVDSMLRTHVGGLAEVFIYGRFANVGIGSFAFDYSAHVIGESACHYKSLPAEFSSVYGGIDWGWTNPAAIVVWGFDGDGRAFQLDEFYGSRISLETLIDEAAKMQEQYGVREFVCGSDEPSSIDKMRKNGVRAVARKSKKEEGVSELGGRFAWADDGRPRIFFHPRCVNTISEMQSFDAEKDENNHAVDGSRYAFEKLAKAKGFVIRF